jgi:type IV pilus assembly protein PilE
LIELMIVIAIVALLAAIAYPSYQDSVRKGRRAEGKAALTEVAQGLEKCKTLYGAYNNANCAIVGQVTGGSTLDSTEGHYAVSATTLTATTFTVQAAPQQADPRCGTLSLTQAGVRASTGSDPVDVCW